MTKSNIKKYPGPRTGPIPPQKKLCLKRGKMKIWAHEDTIRSYQKVLGGEITDDPPPPAENN